jgi:anti-anti-sigma factor
MVDDRGGRLEVGRKTKATELRSATPEFGVATRAFDTGTFCVSAHGDVDLATAPELETELLETAREGTRRVVVDLTGTTFFDSSAVHALVRAGERLQASGLQLGIVCGPYIKRILEITGVDHAFQIHATIERALPHHAGGSVNA